MSCPPTTMDVRKDPLSFERSATISVLVGRDAAQKEFVVHAHFLAKSEFFRRALNGNWLESQTRVIKMPGEDPDVFSWYLEFIYKKQLPINCDDCTVSLAKKAGSYQLRLAELYIIAEQLQDTTVKNAVILEFFNIASGEHPRYSMPLVPSYEAITMVHNGTPPDNALRRMFVHLWTSISPDYVEKYGKHVPHEFLVSVAVKLLKNKGSTDPNHYDCTKAGVEAYLEKE